MTENMIAPDNPKPSNEVLRAAESSAALVTSMVTGRHRAIADLAADRAGELVVPARRRNIDLSTPTGRIRYGYLGAEARNALAELFEALDGVDTADWPLGLVAAREGARQALRLSALADDEQLPDCPTCSVAAEVVEDIMQTLRSANAGQAPAVDSVRGQL